MPSPTPELLRQQNRAIVLATIQEQGPISRVELAALLGLNPATITRIARNLVNEGLLKEEGEVESKGAGRKRVLLRFNHGARLVIGVHVGAQQVTAAIADLAGNLLERRTSLISPRLLTMPLIHLIQELLDANPGYGRGLSAICLTANAGEPISPLIDDLKQRFHVPILHEDTVALAAIGEAEAGQMTEQSAFMLLYLGARSHSCLYLNGEARVGALGLGRDGKPVAAKVCDAGLIQTFGAIRTLGASSALASPTPTARLIFEAARQYDTAAKLAVEAAADQLAFAVASMADALNLTQAVLAGSWVHAADLLIPLLEERIQALGASPLQIVPARLGDDAPLSGAVRLAVRVADTTI